MKGLLLLLVVCFVGCHRPTEEDEEKNLQHNIDKTVERMQDGNKVPIWVNMHEKVRWEWRLGVADQDAPNGVTIAADGIRGEGGVTMDLFFDPTDKTKPFPETWSLVWSEVLNLDTKTYPVYIEFHTDDPEENNFFKVRHLDRRDGFDRKGFAEVYITNIAGNFNPYKRKKGVSYRPDDPIDNYMTCKVNDEDDEIFHHRIAFQDGKLWYEHAPDHEKIRFGYDRKREGMDGILEGPPVSPVKKITLHFKYKTHLPHIGLSTKLPPVKPLPAADSAG